MGHTHSQKETNLAYNGVISKALAERRQKKQQFAKN